MIKRARKIMHELAGQPSGVGEPRTLADLADEIVDAMPYGKISDASIREAILPVLKKALSTPSRTEGASSLADARTELVQKEVGEGLRERVAKAIWDHEIAESIRIKAFPERLAKDYAQWPEDSLSQPYCQRTYRVADAVLAALAAPAPKPAPPAEAPRQCAKCGAYEEAGALREGECVNCGAFLPVRRAAERKPPR